jgi:hypothetical protein
VVSGGVLTKPAKAGGSVTGISISQSFPQAEKEWVGEVLQTASGLIGTKSPEEIEFQVYAICTL